MPLSAQLAYVMASTSPTHEAVSGAWYMWHSSWLRTVKPAHFKSDSQYLRQLAPPTPSPAGCLVIPSLYPVGWAAFANLKPACPCWFVQAVSSGTGGLLSLAIADGCRAWTVKLGNNINTMKTKSKFR